MTDVQLRCKKCGEWFPSDWEIRRREILFNTSTYNDCEDSRAFVVCERCFDEVKKLFKVKKR